ncbi:putative anthocyanin 6''-O-malonyltransferase [Helianthus annuus]|nr:putative anthocyanin 6''-O-malonyltransferase [Helianthus annuus]
MDDIPNLTVLEHSRISPPRDTIGHCSLPLTFFDVTWLLFPPVHHLFFYDFPHPKSHFIETVVPNLKHSLSITLQHCFPFVSNLIVFPTVTRKPEIRHVEGDSVAVTFAESTLDFNDQTGNHPRKCEDFYPLVPALGSAVKESDVTLPLLSVQVTYFLNSGFSIGLTNHHSLGDASTRFCFLKAWTLVSESVTCGYIWSCIAKSFVKRGGKTSEYELEQFVVSVDCRSRLDPPLPATYFGNCIAPCIVTINNVVLSGESGFVIATKLIGEGISKMVNNKEGILKDAERWYDGFKIPARKIGVSGTPKLNFYDMDFGWGKPIKYEAVSFYYMIMETFYISGSKESAAQDLEIGVCFPSLQMEAFANIFNHGLKSAIYQ